MLRETEMKWDFFLCYASEDKNEIAGPIADALSKRGFKVWYDKFSLTLGDSLRRSIDYGLAHSNYGIVILSPNFFAKEWPQSELDALVSLEAKSGKKILPIWHKINHDYIAHFSPLLADRLAISTSKGLNTVVKEIMRSIQTKAREFNNIKKYLFLAGCFVGNRVAIAPFTDDCNPKVLKEFTEILNKIGLSQSPEARAIIRAWKMLLHNKSNLSKTGAFGKVAQAFFNAMNRLPDLVQSNTSPDNFQWFRLGELLYDVITCAYIDVLDSEKGVQYRTFTLPTKTKCSSLETLIKQMNLPTIIRQEIETFINVIKNGKTMQSEEIVKQYWAVNDIAQSLSVWLDTEP